MNRPGRIDRNSVRDMLGIFYKTICIQWMRLILQWRQGDGSRSRCTMWAAKEDGQGVREMVFALCIQESLCVVLPYSEPGAVTQKSGILESLESSPKTLGFDGVLKVPPWSKWNLWTTVHQAGEGRLGFNGFGRRLPVQAS